MMAEKNRLIHYFKASGCKRAIDDVAMTNIAKRLKLLSIFDISYCNEVTDVGLKAFNLTIEEEPATERKFSELTLSGLTKITNEGVISILETCEKTLSVLNLSLID